jgi:hypothetical protein
MPRPRGGVNGVAANGCFFVWGGEGQGIGEPNDGLPRSRRLQPRAPTPGRSWRRLPTPIHGVNRRAFVGGLIYMPAAASRRAAPAAANLPGLPPGDELRVVRNGRVGRFAPLRPPPERAVYVGPTMPHERLHPAHVQRRARGSASPLPQVAHVFAKLRDAAPFKAAALSAAACAVRKEGAAPEITGHLGGYIRIRAVDLEAARALVAGNTVYEAGRYRRDPRTPERRVGDTVRWAACPTRRWQSDGRVGRSAPSRIRR